MLLFPTFIISQNLTSSSNLDITKTWHQEPNGYTYSIDDDGDGFVDNFLGYEGAAENNDPHRRQNLIMDHGTLVAGCVSAMTNNEIGVA